MRSTTRSHNLYFSLIAGMLYEPLLCDKVKYSILFYSEKVFILFCLFFSNYV
jgi:hypothetical protein